MASSYLQTLPTELFVRIVDFCDFRDWKTLRLAIPRAPHSDAVIPHLFEDYYMGYSTLHLEKLEQVTQTPTIAESIKHFVLDLELVPEVHSTAEWHCLVKGQTLAKRRRLSNGEFQVPPEPSDLDGSILREYGAKHRQSFHNEHLPQSEDALEDCYRNYQEYSYDQRYLMLRRHAEFQVAFARLERLQQVTCQTLALADNNRRPPWKGLLSRILVGPDHWVRYNDYNMDRETMPECRFRPAALLVRAIDHRSDCRNTYPITNLSLVNLGFNTIFAKQPIPCASDTGLSDFRGFKDLTTFSLRILMQSCGLEGLYYDEHPSQRNGQLGELSHILSQLKRLRSLRLSVINDEAFDNIEFGEDLDEIAPFAHTTLPCLEHLELKAVFTARTLLDILRGHKATLREIRLVDCALIATRSPASWVEVINDMHRHASIEHFYLEGLFDYQSSHLSRSFSDVWFDQGFDSRSDDPNNLPIVEAIAGRTRIRSSFEERVDYQTLRVHTEDWDPLDYSYIENH